MRLLALAALLPGMALAVPVTLTWQNPTTHTDGSALTVISTRIEYGSCGGTVTAPTFGTKAGEWVQTGAEATSQSPNLSPGTYCFRALARGAVTTACTTPCESVPSNVARKVVAPTAPNPPANLTAQEDLTAWTVVTTDGAIVALEVGQVAPGTACNPDQYVKTSGRAETLYEVPLSAVTFLPGQNAIVTFSACGGG
jgi:hypothetical protein